MTTPLTVIRKEREDSLQLLYAAGSNLLAGAIVAIGGAYGRLLKDVASGATGIAQFGMVCEVPKDAATVFAAGDVGIWNATDSVVERGEKGSGWICVEAPATNATKVLMLITAHVHQYATVVTVSAGQDSANAATIATLLGANFAGPITVQIESTTGVFRNPQSTVVGTAGSYVITDSGLAVNEKIHFRGQVL